MLACSNGRTKENVQQLREGECEYTVKEPE